MLSSEKEFWNNNEIVDYFAAKPADPVIVERLHKLQSQGAALDLGCGGGRHSEILAQLGYAVTAVDVNPAMLEATKNRLEPQSLPVQLAMMSIGGLGLANESFNVVISTGVLHQAKSFQEYDKAISEVARVLKPNGLFSGNIFTNRSWDNTYSLPNNEESYTVVTREGLWMTLLPKDIFYEMTSSHGLELEQEIVEEIKQENTGERAVLRFHMRKT